MKLQVQWIRRFWSQRIGGLALHFVTKTGFRFAVGLCWNFPTAVYVKRYSPDQQYRFGPIIFGWIPSSAAVMPADASGSNQSETQ